MTPSTSSLVLGGLALAFASSLSAQTLAQYTFGTSSNNSSATTTGANVTPGVFGRGAGLASWTFSSAAGAPAPRSIFVTSALVDEPISATSGDWLGFTITATSGNTLKLSELNFYYAYTNTVGTISGSATFEVRSSVDNYGSAIGSFTQAVVNSTTPSWQQASIGLSASQYQGLANVSFRVFLSDGSNASADSQLRLDTVTLTGVSDAGAVPEPSAAVALVGLAGLGFAATRRRRVRSA